MAAALRVVLAATWLLSGVRGVIGANYPSRPVRVVVGFPAGGPTDVIARIVARSSTDNLGQQFFVENIGGAGGNTAAGQVARVTPDGYTIMAISTGFVVNPSLYAKVPYDPVKDFARRDAGRGFAECRGGQPAGAGQDAAGTGAAHQGQSRQIQLCRARGRIDAASGRRAVPAGLQARPGARAFHGAGRRSRQRSAGTRRSPSPRCRLPCRRCRADNCARWAWRQPSGPPGMPDVPTFAEQGVKDQDADTLTGIVAPAGTPKEIVDLLYREIAKIVAQPDVKERLTTLGFKAVANTPDQFGARIRLEMDKWGKVVRDAKLRIE
jgi:tripartite-type tricarboxylate transporter receptor subunit TctC